MVGVGFSKRKVNIGLNLDLPRFRVNLGREGVCFYCHIIIYFSKYTNISINIKLYHLQKLLNYYKISIKEFEFKFL